LIWQILTVLSFPSMVIAPIAFLGFWVNRYDQQRRLVTGKPYIRTRSFWVAQGRGYSPLTSEKMAMIRAKGYRIGYDPQRGHFINIPGVSHIDRVHQAQDIGHNIGLMLLY
jgi:hypothetical protein